VWTMPVGEGWARAGFFYFRKNHCLSSFFLSTLGKQDIFAECLCYETLGKTLGKRAMNVFSPSRCFFCRVSVLALGKVFAECPIKNTRQRNVCLLCVRRVSFAECNTRQSLCRVFFGLCCVPAHGKLPDSGCSLASIDQFVHFK